MVPKSIASETEYFWSIYLRTTEIHGGEKQDERKLEWQLNIDIKATCVLKIQEAVEVFLK